MKGYKLVETLTTNSTIIVKTYTDGINVIYHFSGSTTIIGGVLEKKVKYPPISDITSEVNPYNTDTGGRIRIADDGGIAFQKNSNSSSYTCTFQTTVSTFLKNPLY